MSAVDILILSNGPGELATWVKPVVKALRAQLGDDRAQVRISVVLSPCPNASGQEAAIAQSYPEVDRVQAAEHFAAFLLSGKTVDAWEWRDRGVVLFLGGDQFFPVVVGKRLGYRTVVYAEWDARWLRWIDRFGVMKPEIAAQAPPAQAHKFTVVGDLMAEAGTFERPKNHLTDASTGKSTELIGLLPGSKPAKLAQGVPLTLAIAERIHAIRPQTRFVIPVAPTLSLQTLAQFADPEENSISQLFGGVGAHLVVPEAGQQPYLKTAAGVQVELRTDFPAYDLLSQCQLCLTTVGANTAELGSLAVPMIVLIPMQQADAMRAWGGIPGLLVNLPGVGSSFAKLINWWFLSKPRLLAWPNIWAQEQIVPEKVGIVQPQEIADLALDWLEHPEQLQQIRDRLRSVRGQPGAATKLSQIVAEELRFNSAPHS
ncbi:lipid-A-disaccharide synthase [Trichocoleus sp. FACHB-262]|uniref:lipid-A-disaccharide synthase n=1 Tax=Trichocoleus sp. FACHB-262 TaxID=2692869 RepID=UPI001687B794|nr:lipid-A-disaccharide synthase [Trichocoleus sp. FACHB-262]MBD2121898.1 lipid-A-disaccharide synthase [Trichocoleus sp. FACHB-262]